MAEQELRIKLDTKTIGLGVLFMMMLSFGAGLFFQSLQKTEKVSAEVAPTAEQAAPVATEDMSLIPVATAEDHILGSPDAEVVMITYTDFECPFCQRFHPVAEQIKEEYGDKIAIVYRNYPLDFHPKAQKTAEAAECVAELGGNDAYWKMADMIFEKMPSLEVSQLGDLAASVGVDKTKFDSCLASGKYAEKISGERSIAASAGIQGTPGSAIIGKNGKREFVPGALPFDQVKQLVEKVL